MASRTLLRATLLRGVLPPARLVTVRAFHAVAGHPSPSTSSNTVGPSVSSVINQPPPSSSVHSHNSNVHTPEVHNAAFLGEADSNDSLEADREVHPEDYRHNITDARNAAFLGEADSNDGFEARVAAIGQHLDALDASRAAFLGEADSNDEHEFDREVNPAKYDHKLEDVRNAAYLGEADSDDAFEADIEVHPERHHHSIEDTRESGFHGERGEER